MIKDITLIDFSNPNYKEFASKIVYVCNNLVNVDNNSENVDNNSQSKVKENKVKEIETTTNENSDVVDEIIVNDKITDFWNDNIGLMTPYETEVISGYLKDMEVDLILLAMKKAVSAKVRTLKYIEGILKNWQKDNIKTVLEVEQADEKFKNKSNSVEETEEERQSRIAQEIKEMEERVAKMNDGY